MKHNLILGAATSALFTMTIASAQTGSMPDPSSPVQTEDRATPTETRDSMPDSLVPLDRLPADRASRLDDKSLQDRLRLRRNGASEGISKRDDLDAECPGERTDVLGNLAFELRRGQRRERPVTPAVGPDFGERLPRETRDLLFAHSGREGSIPLRELGEPAPPIFFGGVRQAPVELPGFVAVQAHLFERGIELLPPERPSGRRAVAGEEERRGYSSVLEERKRARQVVPVAVVESECDRTVLHPALSHRIRELAEGDRPEARDQAVELLFEVLW